MDLSSPKAHRHCRGGPVGLPIVLPASVKLLMLRASGRDSFPRRSRRCITTPDMSGQTPVGHRTAPTGGPEGVVDMGRAVEGEQR